MSKKLTLQLTPEMEEVLDDLVATRGMPKSQVLRRAVLLMKYLDEQAADNKDILVRDNETGTAERLVLESQMTRKKTAVEARPRRSQSAST